ncbi:hypothetical protein BJY16_008326 [Actinoplanes octamycinicus]|uniref:Uncharacterized protein n=1 Tax=Actinoplanes octamycinicus TaxID=135948 RepID=A0A7W7H6S9_9ACTN|nr:hypothetical protein [Actinoplanes octamycinicus]MBB4744867.1 hypothetical protein [Actinoplanes octamycinicus]GIE55453.1 hypothetical protein Aoc01nite_08550 [Actinoplanes octamycinicus]
MKTRATIIAAAVGLALGASLATTPAHAAPGGGQAPADDKLQSFWSKQECVDAGKLGKDNDDWDSFKCRASDDAAGNELWVLYVSRDDKPAPKPEPKPDPEEPKPGKPSKVKNPLDVCTWTPWLCED